MFIPNNLSSTDIDLAYMESFIQEELDAGCFDGTFMIQQAHIIFNGHFRTAPLGFIEKLGSTALRLICHHSKEDAFSQSTNSWLDPFLDATMLYMATDAADLVSLTSSFCSPLPLPPTLYFQNLRILYHSKILHCPIIYIASQYAVEAQGIFPACKCPGPRDWP